MRTATQTRDRPQVCWGPYSPHAPRPTPHGHGGATSRLSLPYALRLYPLTQVTE